ncbi:MAG: NTP transferase domain-containing protein [Gemmatimonadales bacterium]
MTIPIVILAAGGSRRLKQPKQLVSYRGMTLLRHAANAALESGVGPVIVVLGAEAKACREDLSGLDVALLLHSGWGEGLGSTIRVGVRAARSGHPGLGAMLLMTCDQPGVDAGMLRTLADTWRKGGARIAASGYAGTAGIPAVFAASEFAALESLIGDRGAQTLLRSGTGVAIVPCPAAELDVDESRDLDRLSSGDVAPRARNS